MFKIVLGLRFNVGFETWVSTTTQIEPTFSDKVRKTFQNVKDFSEL